METIPEYAPLEKYARNNLFVSCKRLSFSFSKINREEILGKITKFEHSEICQDTDIPTRVIKNIVDTFANVPIQISLILAKFLIIQPPEKQQISHLYLKKLSNQNFEDEYKKVSIVLNLSNIFK